MKVIYDKLPSRRKKCVVTIGVFDGIHLGHRFILEKVKKDAKKKHISSLVITFDTAPGQFLNKVLPANKRKNLKPFLGYLADTSEKSRLVKSLGINYLWFLKTKQSLLKLSARDFMEYIFKFFDVKKLIVGEDFRFGHKGKGDLNYLKKLKKEYNFELLILKKKNKYGKIISSSIIRELIKRGNLKQVKKFLGRNFSMNGKVGKGKGIGTTLGFPTANVSSLNYVMPLGGVYAAWVALAGEIYLAVVNIGLRPTFTHSKKKTTIEVHILNFNKNILGQNIKIIFLEKIRNERKFSSSDALRTFIQKDIDCVTAKYSICPPKYTQVVVL